MSMPGMNMTMAPGGMGTMDMGTMEMGTMDMDMGGNSTMNMHSDDGNMMMQMSFYFGIENVTILFKSWTVNSAGAMVGACFAVFLLALLYEGLKVLREHLLRKTFVKTSYANGNGTQTVAPLMDSTNVRAPSQRSTIWSSWHFLQTFLHLLQVTISYALMLIFMTYNGYLAISIIVGAAVGYFSFGWKKAVVIDINEHCH